jgi:hypothetical protein
LQKLIQAKVEVSALQVTLFILIWLLTQQWSDLNY